MKVTFEDFKNYSFQATIFTPGHNLDVAQVMSALYTNLPDVFKKATPVVLPATLGVPRELSLITLTKTDWSLDIGPERANIKWGNIETESPPTPDEFITVSHQIFSKYLDAVSCKIRRLAFIVTKYIKCDEPGIFLSHHFCDKKWIKEPLNRSENFELHAHKSYTFEDADFTVNSWIRNRSLNINYTDKPPERILSVQQDINTLTDLNLSKEYSNTDINQFFVIASKEIDKILKLYYPK